MYQETRRGTCGHVCADKPRSRLGFLFCEYCDRWVPPKPEDQPVMRRLTHPRGKTPPMVFDELPLD